MHREIPHDPELHRQWNSLALRMARPEVFYTSEWALAVQIAYSASLVPLLLLGYEGNDLIGVASLAMPVGTKSATFLASNTADYCDFISSPDRRDGFATAVFSRLKSLRLSSIALANLPADSETVKALLNALIRPAYDCAQIQLGVGDPRRQLKASLTGKKKLRRYLRDMARHGPVTFAHLQSRRQIEGAFIEFADAHVARFTAIGKRSSLAAPERRLFLQELASRFDGQKVVTLSALKVNDRAVAWNFGFRFSGSWFWYQPTFDSRFEENSPGYCLLAKIVIEACDMEDIDLIDLGLGAEGYKERFGNRLRHTLHATLTASAPRHLREVVRYRAASLLKRSSKIDAFIRRVLHRDSHSAEKKN
jgi:CelD/BcsL family acetyltransferase involved in cellulose biosynthesis